MVGGQVGRCSQPPASPGFLEVGCSQGDDQCCLTACVLFSFWGAWGEGVSATAARALEWRPNGDVLFHSLAGDWMALPAGPVLSTPQGRKGCFPPAARRVTGGLALLEAGT